MKLRNSKSVTIPLNGAAPVTLDAEQRGPFLIHPMIDRGEPRYDRWAVTPANFPMTCGNFRNITTARRVADRLAGLQGANWLADTREGLLPTPDLFRAAYDLIREDRAAAGC